MLGPPFHCCGILHLLAKEKLLCLVRNTNAFLQPLTFSVFVLTPKAALMAVRLPAQSLRIEILYRAFKISAD